MRTPVQAFEHAILVKRVATRFATEFPTENALKKYLKDHPDADKSNHSVNKKDEGPNPNRVSGGEVSGHLELVTKGLELHPTTWKALSKFRGDLKKENVTTKDVKELVEDLEFAKGQVKDPTKPKGKKTVDKIENVLKFLGGLEKKSPHLFGK